VVRLRKWVVVSSVSRGQRLPDVAAGRRFLAAICRVTSNVSYTEIGESMTKMTKMMTKMQVADLFGISERTLDRWREEGIIDAIRVGGIVRFREEAVEAALAKMSGQTHKTG
jgi:excisionase family DNA binding protein